MDVEKLERRIDTRIGAPLPSCAEVYCDGTAYAVGLDI